jgi:hypothetical protein
VHLDVSAAADNALLVLGKMRQNNPEFLALRRRTYKPLCDNVHLPVLSKPFYLFMGWSTTPDGSEMIIKNVDESFFGSYHLYPYFEPLKYTFTLVTDGTAERVSVAYGEAYTLPIKETEKTFIGYFDIDGIQYTDEQGNSLVPFTDGADITLYARFKEE